MVIFSHTVLCYAAVLKFTIDESHKIFDRMYSYRPAFNDMKQLKSLSCPIIPMSAHATLTGCQVEKLRQEY